VAKSGDTMTGNLSVPANGLVAGSNQLVLSGGNVGIGTTSPNNTLQVAVNTSGTNTNSYAIAASNFTSPTKQVQLGYDGTFDAGIINAVNIGTAFRPLLLNPFGAPVAIGTTNPTNPLTVYSTGPDAIAVAGSGTGGVSLNLNNAFAAKSYSIYNSGNSAGSVAGFVAGTFAIIDNTSNAVRLTVSSTGSVGIGTTSPMGIFDVTYSGGASHALVVNGSGNVGIGSTSPSSTLDVAAASPSVAVARFINTSNTTMAPGVVIQAGIGSGSGASLIAFQGGGGAAIGSITQTSASSIAYNTTSDRRLKEHIVESVSGLDLLKQLKVHDYNYISDPSKQTLQGFIAQELYELYPQAVTVGGEDPATNPWQVDYSKLTPLLVKSLQDLQQQFDQKVAEIAQLKSDSAQMKAALCSLKDMPMCHE